MKGLKLSQLIKPLLVILAGSYLAVISWAGLFYIFSGLRIFANHEWLNFRLFIFWVSVGLSVSLLASLACWPFALSTATLLEHNKKRRLTPWVLRFLSYSSTLPLVIFCFVYVEVLGEKGFQAIESFWIDLFASPNIFTQVLAFGLTIILYPLTALPFFSENPSVDLFYQKMLAAVIEFAEVGLVTSAMVLGLFLYILPKMVLHMRQQLREDQALRSFEIIKSLGGTPWESIHLTVLQSMKTRFNGIITYFTRICFFEGLISYSLLYFFLSPGSASESFHWSSSLSSLFVSSSLNSERSESILLATSGGLVVCFFLFMFLENYFRKKLQVQYV